MDKFVKNQRVVCTDSTDSNYLDTGVEYRVKDILYHGTHITLTGDGYVGGDSSYAIERFESVDNVAVQECKSYNFAELIRESRKGSHDRMMNIIEIITADLAQQIAVYPFKPQWMAYTETFYNQEEAMVYEKMFTDWIKENGSALTVKVQEQHRGDFACVFMVRQEIVGG